MSALPPKADIRHRGRNVGFVARSRTNAASTAPETSPFREMIYSGRQFDPMMHQVLVNRVSRGGELRVRERAHCDTVLSRESFALPINVAAAIRAEMKADLVAAVGITRINLARAPDSHFAFQVGSAGMHNRTCAALACRAMAHIDAVRIRTQSELGSGVVLQRVCESLARPTGHGD